METRAKLQTRLAKANNLLQSGVGIVQQLLSDVTHSPENERFAKLWVQDVLRYSKG